MRTSGPLLTVSNEDNTFECHLRIAEIDRGEFAKKETADGRTLHIVRLLGGADRKTRLSAILAPEETGEPVDDGAIEFWGSLRDRFGDSFELAPDNEESA
jgi:hypothetical protein